MKYHNRIAVVPRPLNRGDGRGQGSASVAERGRWGILCECTGGGRGPTSTVSDTRALRGPGCGCNVGSVPRPSPKRAGERLTTFPPLVSFLTGGGETCRSHCCILYTQGGRRPRRQSGSCVCLFFEGPPTASQAIGRPSSMLMPVTRCAVSVPGRRGRRRPEGYRPGGAS